MMNEADYIVPIGSIQVLPEGLANRIAAGEVVERPSSVVKELIENALDADATHIEVSLKKSGLDEIIVSDNGWGMDSEDLVLAFRRHATSKIATAEDLLRITHLGFRGEALPSIASVARVEVVSRRADRPNGSRYRIEGGKTMKPEPAARERGTTIRIRSLFFNVPARRKFLRSSATEYNHIVNSFKRYALAYPELRWTLIRDDSPVWNLEVTDLEGRIRQLYRNETVADLIPVENRSNDIFVSGVVGGTSLFRKSRGDQYLFINRRPFVGSSLHHAVVNGYAQLINAGEMPFYVLFLRADPGEFDVNVHPAKHEVRFRDESQAYRAVMMGVRNALGASLHEGSAPVSIIGSPASEYRERSEVNLPREKGHRIDGRRELEMLFGHPKASGCGLSALDRQTLETESPEPKTQRLTSDPTPLAGKYDPHHSPSPDLETEEPMIHENLTPTIEEVPVQRTNVWQLHKTYILSQVKSGLVVIDQHVAHERILYERALAAMRDQSWNGQQLLFPVEVTLDPGDSALLEEIQPQLHRLGFEVEHVKDTRWQILSTPAGIKVSSEGKLLREMLADYRNEYNLRLAPQESLAASFACKAAIKKGHPLTLEEMNALIDELFLTQYPFVCPHGRPIVVNLTLQELDKLFGRGL